MFFGGGAHRFIWPTTWMGHLYHHTQMNQETLLKRCPKQFKSNKMGVIAINCFQEETAWQHCCCNHEHIAAIDTSQNWSFQSSIKNGGLVNEAPPTWRTQWLLTYIRGGWIFFSYFCIYCGTRRKNIHGKHQLQPQWGNMSIKWLLERKGEKEAES